MKPRQPGKGREPFEVAWWRRGKARPELRAPDSAEERPLGVTAGRILVTEVFHLFS